MTYCCGVLVRDGLVMIADTRTNAGLDNVSTFRKLHVFSKPGERIMAVASAGNLAISQSVLSTLTEGLEDPHTGDLETLLNSPTMFQAAQRIGRAIRAVHATEGTALQSEDINFDVSFLFGGQIKGSRMRLFMVYPAGNFIECTTDTPYLQIGEHKYGKPVLDRAMHYDVELYEALKTSLISMDSTMRSNLGVGLPIDVLVVRNDVCDADLHHRIEAGEPYFHDLRSRWSAALRAAHQNIPRPPYKRETEPKNIKAGKQMTQAGNKIALVTGAGTGVGRAASLALMNAGFTVVLAGRRVDKLEETKKLGEKVGKSLPVSADMTDPRSIAALFAKVMDVYGRLDVLFNNAGMGAPPVPFEDLSLAQWQAVVSTNLTAPFLCTQHAFRIMKDQTPRGGRIINNGSISAHAPRPFSSAYTSTKHAITGLTKATNLDGRAYDIAVGQIDIGNAATPMTERMVDGVLQPDGRKIPEPRMDANAVGDAVAYMASLPLDANVLFMTVMASKMPFVGRG
jgi:putative proteasome-type protease